MKPKPPAFIGSTIAIAALFALSAAVLPILASAQHSHDHAMPAQEHEHTMPAKEDGSQTGVPSVPRLKAKRVLTVSGNENWSEMTGFGKDTEMAEMMILMMVGGSGMEHMKMQAMKPGSQKKMDPPAASGLPVKVTLAPNPPVVGDNTLDVLVLDSVGKPVTGLKLSADVVMTNMDMGMNRPKIEEGKDGHYAVTVRFAMKGPWRVMLTGDAKGGNKVNAVNTTLDIRVDGKTPWTQPARR